MIFVDFMIIPWTWVHLATQQGPAARSRTRLVQTFVLSGGATHLLMVLTIFVGGLAYYALAFSVLITAVVSSLTAYMFWRSRRGMTPA